MNNSPVMIISNLAKKYCRIDKYSIRYGIIDIINSVFKRAPSSELRKGEFWSLNDISFELKRGECLGIIGANGAGKTTLMKVISGILQPEKGNVITNGKIVSLLEVASGFHPKLTGRENIILKATILGMSPKDINERIEAIISFSGLEDRIDMPVKNYSSGMYSRLGFAIAVHVEADILILDEVFAVGDISFRSKCYNHLSSIKDDTTILLVSHDMRSISRLTDTVLVLSEGQVSYLGEPTAAISHYRSSIARRVSEKKQLNSPHISIHSINYQPKYQQHDDVELQMVLETHIECSFFINIGIRRDDGVHCFGLLSELIKREVDGAFTIKLLFQKLSLMPGFYYFDILILDKNQLGILAYIKNSESFYVEGSEVTQGVYLPEHRWLIESSK